jgi:hypothetical protein
MMIGTSAVSGGWRGGGELSMIGGGQPRLAVAPMASSCRSASPSPAASATIPSAPSSSLASASACVAAVPGASIVSGSAVSSSCSAGAGPAALAPVGAGRISRSRGASVRGASAGGGTTGRRPDELRTCDGARVTAAARVARSEASGSADSGSTITDGKRGRLPMMGAGWVMEIGGFCTVEANGERGPGAGCAPPLPWGRASKNTGSSPTPGSWRRSLEAGDGDSSLTSSDDVGHDCRWRAPPGSASAPIATIGCRRTLSASRGEAGGASARVSSGTATSEASDDPARLLATASDRRSSAAPESSRASELLALATSFLRCKMMRPSAFATSPAMAMTSATSRSTTSASPLSA